jgi:hypothetical protein
MSQCPNVERKKVAVAQYRFHFIDAFFYHTYAVAVEPQLVHGFEHARVYKIALKADVVVVAHVVWFGGQQLHQELVAAVGRIHVNVDNRIHAGCFN